MVRKTRQKPRQPRNRAGMLPGEAKRQSLVTVEAVVDEPGKDRYGNRASLMQPKHYIATTHRLDRQWMYYVEYEGEVWRIPGPVFDRLRSQRDSVIKEQRRTAAQDRHDRLAQVGQEDQAEAERIADLGGQ